MFSHQVEILLIVYDAQKKSKNWVSIDIIFNANQTVCMNQASSISVFYSLRKQMWYSDQSIQNKEFLSNSKIFKNSYINRILIYHSKADFLYFECDIMRHIFKVCTAILTQKL